jgi:hypothetical protein
MRLRRPGPPDTPRFVFMDRRPRNQRPMPPNLGQEAFTKQPRRTTPRTQPRRTSATTQMHLFIVHRRTTVHELKFSAGTRAHWHTGTLASPPLDRVVWGFGNTPESETNMQKGAELVEVQSAATNRYGTIHAGCRHVVSRGHAGSSHCSQCLSCRPRWL